MGRVIAAISCQPTSRFLLFPGSRAHAGNQSGLGRWGGRLTAAPFTVPVIFCMVLNVGLSTGSTCRVNPVAPGSPPVGTSVTVIWTVRWRMLSRHSP